MKQQVSVEGSKGTILNSLWNKLRPEILQEDDPIPFQSDLKWLIE